FIALEGIDASGKSTQCPLLAKWFRENGFGVVECSDPGGTPVGDQIRSIVLNRQQQMGVLCELFLFMASRAELTSLVIRPALAPNQVVITDRFLLSNVVYQGHAAGINPEEIWRVGRLATGGLEPNLTIVLDLTVADAANRRRGRRDRVESRPPEYHEAVRQGFLIEAHRRPSLIRVVDAS